jgi:hypothetical protein
MKLAVSDPATGMGGGDPRNCDVPWPDSRWMALDTAIAGGGNHYHAPDAAALSSVFSEIAGSIAILID